MTGVDKDLATLSFVLADYRSDRGQMALGRVEAELSRLREQRYYEEWNERILRRAAEARCARLQEKLDESYRYRDMYGETIERQRGEIARLQQALIHHGYGPRLCKCANCVAAGPDMPADSQEDKT